MYMLYTVSGSIFLILFGLPLAYDVLWIGDDESWTETEPLVGHPITINRTGHIIAIQQVLYVQVHLHNFRLDHLGSLRVNFTHMIYIFPTDRYKGKQR